MIDIDLPVLERESKEGHAQHVCARFLREAAAQPERVALLFDGGSLSYGDLERRSRALALDLWRAGFSPGSRIAILAERGPEVVWAAIAVSRLGGVFIVLDSAYPLQRLGTLVEICRPDAIIATTAQLNPVADRLAAARGISRFAADVPDAPPEMQLPALGEEVLDGPAYFLFTSGSTGQPKCVACSHRPLTHFVDWHAKTFELTAADRFTMVSGLSHDPWLRDVFTPLSIGASLAIPAQQTLTDPAALSTWFERVGATVTHLTPPLGQILAAGRSRTPRLPRLKRLFWGGDRLSADHIEAIAQLAPQARHVNFYGSTETPQAAAYFEYTGAGSWPSVPIGVGSDGFELLLVDAERALAPAAERGEIAIRSAYLSLGYVEAGQVLAPTDRGGAGPDRRDIYYTGDQGRRLSDGAIVMIGRLDDQVKVRGYRVDLSEVTSALIAHPAVQTGLVLPAGEAGDVRLVAFAQRRGQVATDELAAFLADRLPSHMVPREIRWLDAFPLLPNGKIDRAALKASLAVAAAPERPARSATRSDLERALIESWADLLGRSPISPNDSFIGLGGDSLSYVRAYLVLEKLLGEAPADWPSMSIAELAALKSGGRGAWRTVDTSMVVRAGGMLLAVAGHLASSIERSGSTTALLLVSGYLFGGLQLKKVFQGRSALPVLRSVWNIALPTAAFALAVAFVAMLRGHKTPLAVLTFTNDFAHYEALWRAGYRLEDMQLHLWYVHALLHLLLFVFVAYEIAKRAFGANLRSRSFLWALFALGCGLRFLLPAVVDPEFFRHGVPFKSYFGYAGTSQLATFALGALLAGSFCARGKRSMMGVTALYSAATAAVFGLPFGLAVFGSGAALLYLPRVRAPSLVAAGVMLISSASLYIYLSQYVFFGLVDHTVKHLGTHELHLLKFAVALVGGLLVWRGWVIASGVGAAMIRSMRAVLGGWRGPTSAALAVQTSAHILSRLW